MIFLLVVILFFNLWFAYHSFRNIVSPPVLMGTGMFLASIIAASYYEEWNMKQMLFESVWILGGGTVFFTLCCTILNQRSITKKCDITKIDMTFIKIKRLKLFYVCAILLGALVLIAKIYYMRSEFGSLGLSQLIVARRVDHWAGYNEFTIPSIIRMAGSFSIVLCYLTIWCLSIQIVSKHKDKLLKHLLICQLGIVVFDGMLTGSKGSMIALPVSFIIIYTFFYYSKLGCFYLKKTFFIKLFLCFIILSTCFKGLNLIIGREVEDVKNIDLFAEYCGAEIKNFDIYLHQHPNGNPSSKYWGKNTFYALYSEIDPSFSRGNGEYQFVGMKSLGNVYTQFRSYHEDFGTVGVFLIIMLIAIISMYFYNNTFKYMQKPTTFNIYIIIYSTMGMSLFMAFFSTKITEELFRLGYLRQTIYFFVLIWFTRKYLFYKIK